MVCKEAIVVYMKELSPYLVWRSWRNSRNSSVRMAGNLAEIQVGYFSISSVERNRFSKLGCRDVM
jgi:hypothetical protein